MRTQKPKQKYIDNKMVRLINKIQKEHNLSSFREASRLTAELVRRQIK